MRRSFLHDMLNKQVLRTFMFTPAFGWLEVTVDESQQFFEKDLKKMNLHDCTTYRRTIGGKLDFFIVAFYCNENRRDLKFVNSVLEDIINMHEEVMNIKGA